jgi:cytidine deaminase
MEDTELLERARSAVERSYAPYSGYRVGAALAADDGAVFTGCNVENANYSNSVHAEELALSNAVAAGHRSFDSIAVSSEPRDGVTPCGMCRQSLAEFCDAEFRVVCEDDPDQAVYSLGTLLPDPIATEYLE